MARLKVHSHATYWSRSRCLKPLDAATQDADAMTAPNNDLHKRSENVRLRTLTYGKRPNFEAKLNVSQQRATRISRVVHLGQRQRCRVAQVAPQHHYKYFNSDRERYNTVFAGLCQYMQQWVYVPYAPGGTRTHNRPLRRRMLYPVELRALQ